MEVIDFISENYRWLVSVILGCCCIAVTLLKNKVKVVDSAKEFILDQLPLLISAAEKMFDSGSKKKEFVSSSMMDLLYESFPNVKVASYTGFISRSIEKILSTPEKKEVKR